MLHNIFRKINPDSHSSWRKICLHRMSWFIDYAEINNTAIMLACSHTVMYRDGECESEIDEVTGKGIISIQGPSFLLSFCMHVICGCLCACVWKAVVSSMKMESGLPGQCPISIIPWSVIYIKNETHYCSPRDFHSISCCLCTAPGLDSKFAFISSYLQTSK